MIHSLNAEEKRAGSSTSLPSSYPPSTLHTDEEPSSTSSAPSKIIDHENNLHAWLTVAGSSLVYFASYGLINSFGFFQTYYETNLLVGVPASTVSFVGTLQLTLMNLLAAPAGSLFDCFGLKVLRLHSCVVIRNLTCTGFVHIFWNQLRRRPSMPFLCPIRVAMADFPRPRRFPRHRHLLRRTAGTGRRRSAFCAQTRPCAGYSGCGGECGRCMFPCYLCKAGGGRGGGVCVGVEGGCGDCGVSTILTWKLGM
jgi:hypothetical protein